MILILRGHIRDSFKNKILYSFLKILNNKIKLDVYIHTWNIYSNNLSWRNQIKDERNVTEETIINYFEDIKHIIKKIIIDDDREIILKGNLDGNICNSKISKKGWKNYWYGQKRILDYIYDEYSKKNVELHKINIINTRFDLFDNSFTYNIYYVFSFIKKFYNKNIKKNIFISFTLGCDNMYIGNIITMSKLVNHFNFNLDYICNHYKYSNIIHQEFLTIYENNRINYYNIYYNK